MQCMDSLHNLSSAEAQDLHSLPRREAAEGGTSDISRDRTPPPHFTDSETEAQKEQVVHPR